MAIMAQAESIKQAETVARYYKYFYREVQILPRLKKPRYLIDCKELLQKGGAALGEKAND